LSRRAGGHVAFVNIPAVSHLYPTLAVVAELVRRGHRVSYASIRQREPLLRAVGARLVPYSSTRPTDTDPSLRFGGGTEQMSQSMLSFLREARLTLPQLEPVFRRDRPDLVVHDRMAFVGRILAGKLGVPTVEMWPQLVSGEPWSMAQAAGFDPTHPLFLRYLAEVGALLAEHGLATEPAEFLGPSAVRHLAFFPRSFQYGGERFDDRYRFVGPCPRPSTVERRWQRPSSGQPVVLVTLGSLNNRHPDFYRLCFAAFAGSPWHAVIAVGQRFDPAELGPPPDHVEVYPVVPQLAVLAGAAAFVSHAGMGGVMEALAAGVPQVAVPFTPEQELNAARLAELGVGVRLDRIGLTPAALREAVDLVAKDDGVAERIRAVQRELAASGGPARAADTIEECL
jgi:MGT family glycosyltransferase